MLAHVTKLSGKNAIGERRVQIKGRKYATLTRDIHEPHFVPETTVLREVLHNKEGHKTLAQAYKEVLQRQDAFRTEMLQTISRDFGNTPFVAVRAAAADLSASIHEMSSGPALDMAGLTLPTQSIDEVLETHEVAELYSQYAKAFSQLPYVPTESNLNVDDILVHGFAGTVAELKAAQQAVGKLIKDAEAQLSVASKSASDLMYVQADDILAAHPEIEAQLDEEIKENRWDLLAKDDA